MKRVVCILIFVCLLLPCLTSCNMASYIEAKRLIKKQDYHAAYKIFEQLGEYKDAEKYSARFQYVPIKATEGNNDMSSTRVPKRCGE